MRLVLVTLHTSKNPEAIPLGAACIAAAIKAHPDLGTNVIVSIHESWMDSPAGSLQKLANEIIATAPDIVGFSVYLWNRTALRQLSELLHHALPHTKFFAGGPDASALPERTINDFNVDFVVSGEGEQATCDCLVQILAKSPHPKINKSVAIDPELLTSPWLDGTLIPQNGGGVLWELARGCPFACTFCYESRGERGVRLFPLKRLEEEFDLFCQSKVRHVFVLDPTFNANRTRTKELLELFKHADPAMRFTFEIRAEFLDQAQAIAFSELNCTVQIGLQSAHPGILARVGRNLDRHEYERKIALLNNSNVVYGFDLIYGLPGDTLVGFQQSLDWTIKLQPNHLDVFPLAILPGTQLADDAEGFNIEWQSDAPYLVTSQPGFTTEDMTQAASLAAAVDLMYNRGRAVPWFSLICKALSCKPSAVFNNFASFLQTQHSSKSFEDTHIAIEALQLDFFNAQFTQCGKTTLWPAAHDMIVLNGAISRALAEGNESLLDLSYHPDALDDASIIDLARFVVRQPCQPCSLRIYIQGGQLRMKTGKRK